MIKKDVKTMSDVVTLSLLKEIESLLGEPIDRKVRTMIVLQLSL